jgi:energy-coupling factor transporter transmembrane protein EcfT
MILWIFISIIIITLTLIIIFNHKKEHAESIIVLSIMGTLILTGIAIGITTLIWSNTTEKTPATEEAKYSLNPVDNETLNGRQYYLVKDQYGYYTYAIITEDKIIQPHDTKTPNIIEDEEEKPYLTYTVTGETTPDGTWLLPWLTPNTKETGRTETFHIPTKSTKYYRE